MVESRWLSGVAGMPVHLKCENLQRTGSFKVRGSAVRIARLSDEERARGVVAASAGNHAQGVALAAQLHGIAATVFMPEGAPIPKERATRGYGAEVRFTPGVLEDCLAAATAFAEETGAVLIHPFDHPDIVAGQGTLGLEVIEQVPDAATVVVPTGGGGLLGGVAIAVKSLRPDVRVVGVQAAGAAAFPPSLAEGRPIRLPQMATMADGIAVGRPGELTFRLVQEYVDDMLTVSEEALSRALARARRAREAGRRAGRCRRGGGALRGPGPFRRPGRRRPVRRQHRPAAARQGDPARHGRGPPLPQPAGHAARPARAGWRGC